MSSNRSDAGAVAAHYGAAGDLAETILQALRRAGKDPARLVLADLAAVDQFHIRGHAATAELAALAGLRPGERVLDVGSGLGGPARMLAADYGAQVTGLDLTESYCRAASLLTELTGLADRVRFRQGSALDMPFPDSSFDLVWTQHAAMNIADKPRLYDEIRRVLRPGGRLALYDVLAGPHADGLHFPVPWARRPEISFLATADGLRAVLAAAGFREVAWRDVTDPALAWFREMQAKRAAMAEPPALGLHLLLGRDAAAMAANLVRNLAEGRLAVVQAVLQRPDAG